MASAFAANRAAAAAAHSSAQSTQRRGSAPLVSSTPRPSSLRSAVSVSDPRGTKHRALWATGAAFPRIVSHPHVVRSNHRIANRRRLDRKGRLVAIICTHVILSLTAPENLRPMCQSWWVEQVNRRSGSIVCKASAKKQVKAAVSGQYPTF